MFATLENVGDVFKLLAHSSSNYPMKPKKMVFELSEDGTFYHTEFYVDIVDHNTDKKCDGYIKCKSKIPSFIETFDLVYDRRDMDEVVFTITIPNDEEVG